MVILEGIPGKQASIVWVVSFLWATILDNMEYKRKNIDKCSPIFGDTRVETMHKGMDLARLPKMTSKGPDSSK